MRCGLAASLTSLAILASILTRPVPGSAAEPLNETVVPPSPTTVQVTPPPKGTITSQPSPDAPEVKDKAAGAAILQWTQIKSWLLPFAGGILVWIVASITLLVLAALLVLYVRRRRRPTPGPSQISSVPLLKSADGGLYFRLDRLSEDGLIRAQEITKKNRDLAIFITLGLYALNIIEANVDAHLDDRAFNRNLSFRPSLYIDPIDSQAYAGMNLKIGF